MEPIRVDPARSRARDVPYASGSVLLAFLGGETVEVKNPYVTDYVAKTRHLTQGQHGAYFLLMLHYYATGKPLPVDAMQLQIICNCKTEQEKQDLSFVLRAFFKEKNGSFRHRRIERELAKRSSIRSKRKKIGRNGGLAKARNLLELKATQSQSQSHTQSTKPKPTPAFAVPEWIPTELWDSYEEMRKKIRKPMTDRARELAVKDLGLLKSEGYDLTEVIEQSVKQSWAGLFPVRGGVQAKKPAVVETMTAEEEAWARKFQASEKARVNGRS